MPNIYRFESVENFRDLSGYACDYGQTQAGVIYRSSSLGVASEEDVLEMKALGIKTVIDLREPKSKEELPNPFLNEEGIAYISLNVNGDGRIPKDYNEQFETYMEMLEDPFSARTIFKTLIRAEKPILMHCNAGKDRTGIFSAVLLLLAGVSMDDVNDDYLLSYELLPKMAKAGREKGLPDMLLTPYPDFLPAFFARFFTRYGSFAEYFEAIGIDEDDANALKNILGKQEKSCGAVVFHEGKVLVEHMVQGHYSLPKGHVEPQDENEFATAKREILEETGLVVSIVPNFKFITAYSPRPGHFKEVDWFIAETSLPYLKLQKEEVSDAYWLTPRDAYLVLSHDSDREVLEAACNAYCE